MLHPPGAHDFEAVQPGAARVLGEVSCLLIACRTHDATLRVRPMQVRGLGRYCLCASSRLQPASIADRREPPTQIGECGIQIGAGAAESHVAVRTNDVLRRSLDTLRADPTAATASMSS